MIEPNVKHVLKAVAWDALRAACAIEATVEENPRAAVYKKLGELMENLLTDTAEKLSNPETWEKNGGAKN